MTEVSIASVLEFTAVQGPRARLGLHAPHEVMNPNPELGIRICAKGSCPWAVMVSIPSLPSCSALQRSCQKYEEGERALQEARWIESEHQEGLRAIQRQMEQLRHHQELLHQANAPSPSILSLWPVCQGSEPLSTASLSPWDGAGSAKHGSAEEAA